MTEAWIENLEAESPEYDREAGERYDEGEGESYDAEGSWERERRERARRIALARQRAQTRAAWTRPAPTAPSGPIPPRQVQAAVNAVKTLDLETKVQEDALRKAMRYQSRRMSRSEYAAVAGAATNQFIETFDAPDNAFFRAALRFAPLLLLAPQPRGRGFEAFITDPRVVGGAAVAGIVFVGENRKRFTLARDVRVVGPDEIAKGEKVTFFADVVDGRGTRLTIPVKWESSDTSVATVDSNGVVVATAAGGTTTITAEANGAVTRVFLNVV